MKKVFAMLLLVLMIFIFSVTANAEVDKKFFLDGKFSMETPITYYYFGEDTPEDSEELKEVGLTKEELLDYMRGANHVYISKKLDEEIFVFYEETASLPFEFYTAPELIEVQKEMKSDYEEMGYKVVETGIEEGVDADFVFVEISETDEIYPMLIYKTVHKGIYIEFIYIYYGEGEIEYWDTKALASYTEFYGGDEYLKNTYPVEYTVDGIGTKFTLPKGWYLDVNSEGGLMAIKSKNIMMAYFSYDGWENELTEEDRSLTKRSDYNMELFTEEEFKEIIESDHMIDVYSGLGLDIIANSTEMTKCGEYDCVSWKLESESNEYVFNEATAFMYIENAVVHIFIFTGPFEGKTAEEYKGIVASAKFPEIPDEGGEKAEEATKGAALFAGFVSGAIKYLIIAGICSFVAFAIKKSKGKSVKKESTPNYKEVYAPEEKEHKAKFCTECGAQLDENDKFCPVCGTKVKK